MAKKPETVKAESQNFSKAAFVQAAQSSKEKLMLQTLLDDEKTYTKAEVEKVIKNWKSKEVR